MSKTWSSNKFIHKYYLIQQYDFSDGLFYLVIAMTFSDLLNVLISPSSTHHQGFTSLNRSSPKKKTQSRNSKYKNKLQNSSETAASSQKGMLPPSNLSDDENHIQINDFEPISSDTEKPSIAKSIPNNLFTVKEARTSNEISNPALVLNSQHHVQIPRRSSNVFFPPDQIASSRLNFCLLMTIFIILVVLKFHKIGVLSAFTVGLFMRVCIKTCNGFCMECSPIDCLDKTLGDKNICGIGMFPSPRLAAKRRMDKERIYQEICAQERQNEDVDKEDTDKSSIGYVSMQIDRNVLYQRYTLNH